MYPKLHHGQTENSVTTKALLAGWAKDWRALGVAVVGWGWLEGDPETEAELAVALCEEFDLDGYIGNAEAPYEGPDNAWKSGAFTKRFREIAPRAPLGLSYIGYGNPYRDLPFKPWVDAGAMFLPQCYEGDESMSIYPSLWSADNAGLPRLRLLPTVGTSAFATLYPPDLLAAELIRERFRYNVWLLESTSDDALRALQPAA